MKTCQYLHGSTSNSTPPTVSKYVIVFFRPGRIPQTRDIRAKTENSLGKLGQDDLSECNRAFGSLRCYRRSRALCVFLTPSAVLLILTVLTVPEAITDQRAALPEDAGIAGRFGSHCGERQKNHKHRTSAGLLEDQKCFSKAVNLNVANTGE